MLKRFTRSSRSSHTINKDTPTAYNNSKSLCWIVMESNLCPFFGLLMQWDCRFIGAAMTTLVVPALGHYTATILGLCT